MAQRRSTRDPSLKERRRSTFNFDDIKSEIHDSPYFRQLKDDSDASVATLDRFLYNFENTISANPSVRFYMLLGFLVLLVFLLGGIWAVITKYDEQQADLGTAVFVAFQVMITGGYDDSIGHFDQRVLLFFMTASGLVFVSILIGLITDTVNHYMQVLDEGTTKVAEVDHALILGWNGATLRVVVQSAYIRRVFMKQNETVLRRIFPWLRVQPSTELAIQPIVLMNRTKSKREMEELTRAAFAAAGLGKQRTVIGKDVVFRTGDPTQSHDLVRVSAHRARAIAVMMTKEDSAERNDSLGATDNSATIRTILALRKVIYSHGSFCKNLRIVVQLNSPCPFLETIPLISPEGEMVIYSQDLKQYINSVLFFCAQKPGLSRVLMDLYDFNGVSIRSRTASQLRGGRKNQLGWFEGKTMRTALSDHCWGNAVVIGVTPHEQLKHEDDRDHSSVSLKGAGLLGDPEREILGDDKIIFVSGTTSPAVTTRKRDLADFVREAAQFKPKVARSIGKPKQILLCGFRFEWQSNIKRFKHRIRDMAGGLAKGSTLTCLNIMDSKKFGELVCGAGVGFTPEGDGWIIDDKGFEGFSIKHFQADPIKMEEVRELFDSGARFTTAVCLGSVVGKYLTNSARDSRIMAMLLILRQLSTEKAMNMHIIAETQQDQTASLAVVPNNGSLAHKPDFVNTQQMISRSLVMNLAYPKIQNALKALLISYPGTPEVDFVMPGTLSIQGEEVTIGAVNRLLDTFFSGAVICLGYFNGSDHELAPALGEAVKWTQHHRIIVLRRQAADETPQFNISSSGSSESISDMIRQSKSKNEQALDVEKISL